MHNTKMKVATRNNLLRKLSNSKWGAKSTIRTTALALCYYVAEYAAPVCARVEKTKQETNEAHSLYGQNPAERRLESKNCFLRSVKPADFPPKVIRCSAWLRRLQAIPQPCSLDDLNKFNDTAKKCVERWKTLV